MVGSWTYLPGLALIAGCQSFHVPASTPRLDIDAPLRQLSVRRGLIRSVGRPSQVGQAWLAGRSKWHLEASASPNAGVDQSAGGHGDGLEVPAPYRPECLWWTKSRAEEDATINLMANAGFIMIVSFFALFTFFTVDADVSRGWTTSELIFRMPIDNWAAYSEILLVNPVLVKACTSGIVYSLGDWTAQTFEGVALADIKRGRVLRSALAGLLLHGPMSHVWYGLCEAGFDFLGWNDNWWVTAPKIVTDQLFWGPFWNAVYICFLGVLKRDSFGAIWEAITSTAVPLVIAGLRLWPLAHVITYGVIPTNNRLLWVDFVEIVWVTILSRQAADQARSAGEETKLAGAGSPTVTNEPEVVERVGEPSSGASSHAPLEAAALVMENVSRPGVEASPMVEAK